MVNNETIIEFLKNTDKSVFETFFNQKINNINANERFIYFEDGDSICVSSYNLFSLYGRFFDTDAFIARVTRIKNIQDILK